MRFHSRILAGLCLVCTLFGATMKPVTHVEKEAKDGEEEKTPIYKGGEKIEMAEAVEEKNVEKEEVKIIDPEDKEKVMYTKLGAKVCGSLLRSQVVVSEQPQGRKL